jgi:sugar/nucleoside kinase (ribokinase family)
MTPDLVTVGGLTVDNVISADGTVALSRVGGNAAYSGVGALCWVKSVGLVSIAVASYPRATLDRLVANGILLDGVVTSPALLEYSDWFIYDEEGNRNEKLRSRPRELAAAGFDDKKLSPGEVARWIEFLRSRDPPAEMSYSQFRDANPLRPEQVPADYLGARGVHLAPCRPVVLHGMLSVFGPRDMVVTMDPGWQLANESLDDLAPLLRQVDAFLPSEVELNALVPGASLGEALATLARLCKGAVAVKRGPKGSLIWDRAKQETVPVPVVATTAIDPTGAGDSFSGGFLAGLVETGDPVLAACFGTVSASLIVSKFGADGAVPLDRPSCRKKMGELTGRIGRPIASTTPVSE